MQDLAARVLVLGGGIAGLTAAHELAERGFDVIVCERHTDLGGRARTAPVRNSGVGGRPDLPGEHGWRLFAGFYRNVHNTMRRIPARGRATVYDDLVALPGVCYARNAPRRNLSIRHPRRMTVGARPRFLLSTMSAMLRAVPFRELVTFVRRMLLYLTSCDERRARQWDDMSWWEFLQADHMSEDYQNMLASGVTQHLVGARADHASAMTIGAVAEAYSRVFAGHGDDRRINSVLNGPTAEAWFQPWVQHLESLGVQFETGTAVRSLRVSRGQIAAARVSHSGGSRSEIEADWFVCALPLNAARSLLLNDAIGEIDPHLQRLNGLQTAMMNGIQLFLRAPFPVFRGVVQFTESPWALVSLSHSQFWRHPLGAYGNGSVRECLSVNIARWDQAGILYDRPAQACSPRQILREVWAQINAGLEKKGRAPLTDDLLMTWAIDPSVRFGPGGADTDEPVTVNTKGSRRLRPSAVTAVPNLFLAGDWVLTDTDIASMESANEAGRRAANGVLAAAGAEADAVEVFGHPGSRLVDTMQRFDTRRFRQGKRHLLDMRGPL